MKFMHRTVEYSKWNHKRNEDVLKYWIIRVTGLYIIYRMRGTRINMTLVNYTPRKKRLLGPLWINGKKILCLDYWTSSHFKYGKKE